MSHTSPPPTGDPTPPDPAPADPRAELQSLRKSLAESERRRALDRALLSAGAIDAESVAIIAAAQPGAASADPGTLIADLKRRKPFLFHPIPPTASTAAPMTPESSPADAAAHHARATGDRRSLLHYLRLKRQPPH